MRSQAKDPNARPNSRLSIDRMQNLLQSCYASWALYALNAVKLRVDSPQGRRLKSAHLKIVWKAVLESALNTWVDLRAESITRFSTVRHGDLSTASDQ